MQGKQRHRRLLAGLTRWRSANRRPERRSPCVRLRRQVSRDVFPSRHMAATVSKALGQILLDHGGRYSEPVGDLLIGQAVTILEDQRYAPPAWQLLERRAQLLRRVVRLQLALDGR